MNDPNLSEHFPRRLLADYAMIAENRSANALPATILRTRSLKARLLLAYLAVGDTVSTAELEAVSEGDVDPEKVLRSSGADSGALARLARVLAMQPLQPNDRAQALSMLDGILEAAGPESIPRSEQELHAQLALAEGRYERARELLRRYRELSELSRECLELDLSNPFVTSNGTPEDEWLPALERLFPGSGLSLVDDGGATPFDRLRVHCPQSVTGPERITVIVTSYRPERSLDTALRSLIAQSWENLEILLIDDGSPHTYSDFLEKCATLDERITLIPLSENSGTYAARNVGLREATGDFVTFQDSDDLSHPRRMESLAHALRSDHSIVGVLSDRLRIRDDLGLTRPGRPQILEAKVSLLFRRSDVLEKVGYMHSIRKAADTEYEQRIRAVFGEPSVLRMRDSVHLLVRDHEDSLSEQDFTGGWTHPARVAYWSAYAEWHQRITASETSPYVAADGRTPIPTPGRLIHRDGSGEGYSYDVAFASDWRQFGGPQKSMLEEIRALTRRGLRVAILHLEAYRFMTFARKNLCSPIQHLIDDGTVDRLLLPDEHAVDLLILRYPPVLQFPPYDRSNLDITQMLIMANQAPSELDGSDLRYVPAACTAAAVELFGVVPAWVPQGPQVREALSEWHLGGADLANFDMPGIVEPYEWCLERRDFRSTIPVIGRHSRDHWTKWPGEASRLLQAYPDSPEIDVRILGGSGTAAEILGEEDIPPNWLSFGYDEVEVEEFLFGLDFWVYFPHEVRNEAFGRAILEALASGCVVILPLHFEETFGDAAVYCAEREVLATIKRYYRDPTRFFEQSARAQQRVREWFSHDSYYELVSSFIADTTGSEDSAMGRVHHSMVKA